MRTAFASGVMRRASSAGSGMRTALVFGGAKCVRPVNGQISLCFCGLPSTGLPFSSSTMYSMPVLVHMTIGAPLLERLGIQPSGKSARAITAKSASQTRKGRMRVMCLN